MTDPLTTATSDPDRTVTLLGLAVAATAVVCTCDGCEGRTVLVPTATVATTPTQLALYNYAAPHHVLSFPAV